MESLALDHALTFVAYISFDGRLSMLQSLPSSTLYDFGASSCPCSLASNSALDQSAGNNRVLDLFDACSYCCQGADGDHVQKH